nr:MAG TPA: hypothetical protein [Caudoviricetes sp.]
MKGKVHVQNNKIAEMRLFFCLFSEIVLCSRKWRAKYADTHSL